MLKIPQDKQVLERFICFTASDFAYSTTLAINHIRL